MVEKEAAQACARFADLEGKPSLCKTIKLIGDPSLKQLRLSCSTRMCHNMSQYAMCHNVQIMCPTRQ